MSVDPQSQTAVDLARFLLRMLNRPGVQLVSFGFRTPESPAEHHGATLTIVIGEDSRLTPLIVRHLESIVEADKQGKPFVGKMHDESCL